MIPSILLSLLISSHAQAKAALQSIQWMNETEVQELHNALEAYYLACGFYPSSLSDLIKPLPNQDCKDAELSAPYSDPDGSRATKMKFLNYTPMKPSRGKVDFQNYEITLRILESK